MILTRLLYADLLRSMLYIEVIQLPNTDLDDVTLSHLLQHTNKIQNTKTNPIQTRAETRNKNSFILAQSKLRRQHGPRRRKQRTATGSGLTGRKIFVWGRPLFTT